MYRFPIILILFFSVLCAEDEDAFISAVGKSMSIIHVPSSSIKELKDFDFENCEVFVKRVRGYDGESPYIGFVKEDSIVVKFHNLDTVLISIPFRATINPGKIVEVKLRVDQGIDIREIVVENCEVFDVRTKERDGPKKGTV